MSTLLHKLSIEADGRYFTPEERQRILSYAESLPERLTVAENLERIEEAALRSVIEEMQSRYPNFARYHDQAWARQFRDMQLVLRAAASAMVLDDPSEMDDRLLYWMRTMFAASNYTPDFVRDCFSRLRDVVRERLEASSADKMSPYLDRAIRILADFPEPATVAV